MAKDESAGLYALQQPVKLTDLQRQDLREGNDCTPCRVMGASAFIGLGVYSYVSGTYQLRQQQAEIMKSKSLFGIRSRQSGIAFISATLVGLGLYRLGN